MCSISPPRITAILLLDAQQSGPTVVLHYQGRVESQESVGVVSRSGVGVIGGVDDEIDLTSGLEAVRRRPSMYFNTDSNLMNQFVLGAMCLALAELHCGSATQIEVTVDENNLTIRDNGLGLSLEDSIDGVPFAERVMTVLFACRDHKAHTALGHELCGVGLVEVETLKQHDEPCEECGLPGTVNVETRKQDCEPPASDPNYPR